VVDSLQLEASVSDMLSSTTGFGRRDLMCFAITILPYTLFHVTLVQNVQGSVPGGLGARRGVTRISLYSLHVCTYVIYVHMYKKTAGFLYVLSSFMQSS